MLRVLHGLIYLVLVHRVKFLKIVWSMEHDYLQRIYNAVKLLNGLVQCAEIAGVVQENCVHVHHVVQRLQQCHVLRLVNDLVLEQVFQRFCNFFTLILRSRYLGCEIPSVLL